MAANNLRCWERHKYRCCRRSRYWDRKFSCSLWRIGPCCSCKCCLHTTLCGQEHTSAGNVIRRSSIELLCFKIFPGDSIASCFFGSNSPNSWITTTFRGHVSLQTRGCRHWTCSCCVWGCVREGFRGCHGCFVCGSVDRLRMLYTDKAFLWPVTLQFRVCTCRSATCTIHWGPFPFVVYIVSHVRCATNSVKRWCLFFFRH